MDYEQLIADMVAQINAASAEVDAIVAACHADGRAENDTETARITELNASLDQYEKRLAMYEQQARRAQAAAQRQTSPDGAPVAPAAPAAPQRQASAPVNVLANPQRQAALRVPASPRDPSGGRGGFTSIGQFASAVHRAAVSSETDPRLPEIFAAQQTTPPQDGGFLVPPDFRDQIMVAIQGDDAMLPRTASMETSSNVMSIPVDNTRPGGTGGPDAYWTGEGQEISETGIKVDNQSLPVHKIASLTYVTDEMLEDSASLTSWLRIRVPEAFTFRINEAIIRGNGVAKPVGILDASNGALITVPNGGASDLNFPLLNALYARMYAPLKSRSVFIMNPEVMAMLPLIAFDDSSGTPIPVYLPANGMADRPFPTLFGRPCIESQHASAYNAMGDIIHADLGSYYSALRTGGVREDVSIHVKFLEDKTAYRWTFRLGGKPAWLRPFVPEQGDFTQSPFVVVAGR